MKMQKDDDKEVDLIQERKEIKVKKKIQNHLMKQRKKV